jgi:DNA-binding GntR family transcriptional regulator
MARYHEVADSLREQIDGGELPVGEALPSADRLAHQYDIGRDTALKALKLLRRDGLVELGRDNVIRVVTGRPPGGGPTVVDVPANGVVRARMPTPWEQSELGLAEGVPVLVVRIGEDEEVHSAVGTTMRWSYDE